MPNPIAVGTAAIVAVLKNPKRNDVRFQNVGTTDIYIKRQIGTVPDIPSATNFDAMISKAGGDPNESFFVTDSTAQFNMVSSGKDWSVSVLETVNVPA